MEGTISTANKTTQEISDKLDSIKKQIRVKSDLLKEHQQLVSWNC